MHSGLSGVSGTNSKFVYLGTSLQEHFLVHFASSLPSARSCLCPIQPLAMSTKDYNRTVDVEDANSIDSDVAQLVITSLERRR